MRKLLLLLWKNYVLYKRKWVSTLAEVLIPIIVVVILLLIRRPVASDYISDYTEWNPFSASLTTPIANSSKNRALIICYTPSNAVYDSIAKSISSSIFYVNSTMGFETEAAMESFFLDVSNTSQASAMAGIVFPTNIMATGSLTYKLRFPFKLRALVNASSSSNPFINTNTWLTSIMFPLQTSNGPRLNGSADGGSPGYRREGFLELQAAIDRAMVQWIVSNGNALGYKTPPSVNVTFRRTPFPPYLNDQFTTVIQSQLPVLIVLGFIFSALNIVRNIVLEKERRLKESLNMLGVGSGTHWTAWFISTGILHLISVIFMTVLMMVKVGGKAVLNYADGTLVFVFLILYTFAFTAFDFALSVLVKSANVGAAISGFIFLISYLPYTYMSYQYSTYGLGVKIISCIVPNLALCMGMRLIGMFEGQVSGLKWGKIRTGPTVDDPFCMLQVFGMLLLDTIVYWLFAWYIENVFPGEFGMPKPWYFPFQRSFWCNCCSAPVSPLTAPNRDMVDDNYAIEHKDFFEDEPTNAVPGVQIRGLTKVFGSGKKRRVAVKNVNLNMYKGQITVLLGHNGAGKTTTMSMLTGFIPPTNGTAFINNYDICTDIDSVRRSLGLCPQHDILFEQMTVEEHLYFFSKLKGVSGKEMQQEIDEMLQRVNLVKKKDVLVQALSGGMKRRLSIAMALIANSQVVILDEPTSGLDPDARREIWTLLQMERSSRTMLLTTHFMDEADVLGDRIAIMAAGQIECCGSSLFLKNCYGANYHLTLVKAETCDSQTVLQLIKSHVPDYKVESNISDEMDVLLPASASSAFVKLFNEIENRKGPLGIRSYGVSVTTMEEVFLKVGNYQEEQMADQEIDNDKLTSVDEELKKVEPQVPKEANGTIEMKDMNHVTTMDVGPLNTGMTLFFQQLRGLLYKRLICFIRNKALTIAQMIVPFIFVLIGMAILKAVPLTQDLPSLTLNMSKFSKIYYPYYTPTDNSLSTDQQALVTSMLNYISSYSQSSAPQVNTEVTSCNDYLKNKSVADVFIYTQQYLGAADFSVRNSTFQWLAYFNNEALHMPAIIQNVIGNALLNFATGGQVGPLVTVNHPMPQTTNDKLDNSSGLSSLASILALTLLFGVSFLAASITVFVIKERSSRAKHLQYLSGVMPVTYWLSNFLWDIVNFLLPIFLIIITLAAFQFPAYVYDNRLGVVFLLLLFFAISAIPFMYILSHLFSVPSMGLIWLTILNIALGCFTVLIVAILRIPSLGLTNVADALNWVFLVISPNYCLGQGFSYIFINYLYLSSCQTDVITALCARNIPHPCCADTCGNNCLSKNPNYLGWEPNGIGQMLTFLMIQFVVFILILCIMESNLFNRLRACCRSCWCCCRASTRGKKSATSQGIDNEAMQIENPAMLDIVAEDEDIAAERRKVNDSDPQQLKNQYSLVLKELIKEYGSFTAVNGLCCTVAPGNCFGLLGVNGAGKTTTFKMLTGDIDITAGDVFINGFDIIRERREAQSSMGYCPQFDALIEELTGRETLTLFARLRGIREGVINQEADRLMKLLQLTKYAEFECGRYSGGNKRKLSTAIALIGSPKLICLDEPTTGMDPVSRRYLWDTLTKYRNLGNTLVLTSHSMEECEALCTNIAIMVNGKFQCLGTCQHLKAKYAEGYTVLIQIPYPEDTEGQANVAALMKFMNDNVGKYEIKDQHQGHIHLHLLKTPTLTWSRVFELMQSNRERLRIMHYSVTQTSLEQVFLGFARDQKQASQ